MNKYFGAIRAILFYSKIICSLWRKLYSKIVRLCSASSKVLRENEATLIYYFRYQPICTSNFFCFQLMVSMKQAELVALFTLYSENDILGCMGRGVEWNIMWSFFNIFHSCRKKFFFFISARFIAKNAIDFMLCRTWQSINSAVDTYRLIESAAWVVALFDLNKICSRYPVFSKDSETLGIYQ